MTWTPIIVKTSVMPMKRTYHSATCVGNKMIVFGGVGKTYTNDIMIFDFGTQNNYSFFFLSDAIYHI